MRLSGGPYTRIKLFQSCGFAGSCQAAKSEHLVGCFEHGLDGLPLLSVLLCHAPCGVNPQPLAVLFDQVRERNKLMVNRLPCA